MSGNTTFQERSFKYGVIFCLIMLRIPVRGLDPESTNSLSNTTDVTHFTGTVEPISPYSSLSEEEYLNGTDNKSIPTQSVVKWEEVSRPLYVTWYQLDPSKSNRILFQEVTDFVCGKSGFCNQSLSNARGICTFECDPCHCDDECHYFGDCCTDVAFQNSDDSTTKSFPYLTCSRDDWTRWENFTNIFMISVCPEDSDLDTATKCHFPDVSVQKEATPVSTPSTYVTYRNVYCAICHGVTGYEAWRHEVKCSLGSKIQQAKSKEELWRLVLDDNGCSVISHPPETVLLRKCYPIGYDTCNATGSLQTAPEPVVESLCGMYIHSVDYYGKTSFFDKYSNIFCAMCNAAKLDIAMGCSRIDSPHIPYPINVLLDFNPNSDIQTSTKQYCEEGSAFDPFSESCKNISCPLRRMLVGNDCEEIFSSASGLGLTLDVTLTPTNGSTGIPSLRLQEQYVDALYGVLADFMPAVIARARFHFYKNNFEFAPADMAHARVNLISTTHRSLPDLENALLSFLSDNFSYVASRGENVTLSGHPSLCVSSIQSPPGLTEVYGSIFSDPLEKLDPTCATIDCYQSIDFESIQLKCPFLEYNISQSEFSFYDANSTIVFKDYSFQFEPNHLVLCGASLKICLEDIANVTKLMSWRAAVRQPDLALSIVSLVCQTMSLVGLALTFLTYSLLPKLRTFPGKNTMALVFHLFLAQLLFLTASGSTDNATLCQVFAVLIHYFWLSSFSWMAVSAYHMHIVFTSIHSQIATIKSNTRRFVRYSATCVCLPSSVIAVCLSVYLIPSGGTESGYGGTVCFLNNPTAIGCFFAAPLLLMLAVNGALFVRTILAIRSVPDMTQSSNVSNKHHVFVYIKLSLLFGFTWTFGIVAELVRSDVLSYLFVILTGSQGIMIFLAYCLNWRIWTMLKTKFGHRSEHSKSHSTNGGPSYPYTVSSDIHSSPRL